MKQARDIMSRDVITISPDTPVSEVAQTLNVNGISGCPVVDGEGALLGIISRTNLLDFAVSDEGRHFAPFFKIVGPGPVKAIELPEDSGEMPDARALMSESVLSVEPAAPVGEVARFMGEECIHRIPVMEDGAIVGIITTMDLLRAFPHGEG